MLKRPDEIKWPGQPKKVLQKFPFLEEGKPITEAVYVEDYNFHDALQKAQQGLGTKITKKDLKERGLLDE